MLERLIEKTDLKKYNFDDHAQNILNDFLLKDEFVEILNGKKSLLGMKQHHGQEVVYTNDENIANHMRLLRDEFNLWTKFYKSPFKSEKQFVLHVEKSRLPNDLKSKILNLSNNKSIVLKKLSSLNQKLQKLHERLQGVFICNSDFKELISSFDYKTTVFALQIFEEDTEESIKWIKDIKRSNLLIISCDSKEIHNYLSKENGCEKLKIGRSKNKNIWIRQV